MKIKFEIEADGQGYTERLFINGELKNKCVHEAVVGGTKRKSGNDYEDVVDEDIASELDNFLGFNLFLYCNRKTEEEDQ